MTKTTWKAFQETTRQGRSSCITAQIVTDGDDDDDDDDNDNEDVLI